MIEKRLLFSFSNILNINLKKTERSIVKDFVIVLVLYD